MTCGIDEAGRGPLAGPVTAAAVILPENFPTKLLNDSKKLSEKKRDKLALLIKEQALCWSVVNIDAKRIDEINILNATLEAMQLAYTKLKVNATQILIDGNKSPNFDSLDHKPLVKAIVKGDATVPEIMAASILAKTHRDSLMLEYATQYPNWKFEKHKGYGSALHRELCFIYGRSPIHRKSFKIKDPKSGEYLN